MIKTRLKPPYNKAGKCTFKARNKPGVYMIFRDEVLAYVGFSASNCYKSFYRHFQDWSTSKQQRVVYNKQDANIKARIIYTNTGSQADKLEKALIIKYKPTDNIQQYWIDYDLDKQEAAVLEFYKSTRATTDEETPF
jgi:hypothetical protein